MKKSIVLLLLTAFLTTGMTINADNNSMLKQQKSEWEDLAEKYESGEMTVVPDKKDNNEVQKGLLGSSGSYPTRKGVILVTDNGSFGELVGHAGIIYSSKETIESLPSTGVQKHTNDWSDRYSDDKVYGVTCSSTSSSQDTEAANYCYEKINKPYNWSFTNTSTREKFYCAQLVYASFLDLHDINLNQGGWICFPIDLVQSDKTSTIYTN